ncbi:hypothetical protein BD413DRAFT_644539 [Trametes elegans]|nr:hypothetical protein BD413DRAFT_644539 [Trametes elegans]
MIGRIALVAALALSIGVPPTYATYACSAGTFSRTGQSPCTKCEPGTYQPDAGQTSCRSAQSGWFAAGPGATSQSICLQGTYSTGGAGSCTLCPAGSYCNGQGQTKPVKCPKGHYSPTKGLGQQCYECPRGTFVAVEGATACCACCSGFYNDQTSQDHCFDCPVRGAYSPAGATNKDQCGNKSGGGLRTCSMSSDTCRGSFPSSGTGRRNAPRQACPRGHQRCPVYGGGARAASECVDVRTDLESCGGCVAPLGAGPGGGRDCSAIPHVDSVTCRKGQCVIGRCASGFVVSADGSKCVASTLNIQGQYRRRAGI